MEKNTVVPNTLPKTAWNSLSQAEKAEIIKVAVKHNITDLKTIRQKYNEFAEGGNMFDEDYYTTMYKVAKENNPTWNTMRREEGSPELSVDAEYTRILNDNTYDYKGYYNKYPQSQADAKSHWTDEFKTVWHPTFSVESRYSGKKSEYNPFGLEGGIPEKNDMPFIPTAWQRYEANRYGSGGPLVEAANIYDGTTMPTQQMQTDATYVNTPIAPIYFPVHQLPEVTVRPDSNLSPAERVLAEKARKQAHDRAFGKGSYDAYRRQEQTDYLRNKAARPTNVDFALGCAAALFSGIGQGADIVSMTMGGLPVYSALKGAKALSEKDYVDGAIWMAPMHGVVGKKVYDAAKRAIEKVGDISAYANSQKNAATQLKTRMSDPEYAHIIKDNSNPSFMVEGEPIYLEGLDPKAQATKTFFQDKISKLPIKPNIMSYLHTEVSKALRNHMPFVLPYSRYAYIPKKEKTLAKQHIASVTDNKTRQHQYSIIKAHEGAHVYSCPKKPSPLSPYIDRLNITYFTNRNDAELAARGSQIKNYFDKKKINATELKYAADHYVQDTGIDNNMTEMFDYLRRAAKKNPKIWKKQAAWISNTSPAIAFGLYNLQKND